MYKHAWYTVDQGTGLRCDKCDEWMSAFEGKEAELKETCPFEDEEEMNTV